MICHLSRIYSVTEISQMRLLRVVTKFVGEKRRTFVAIKSERMRLVSQEEAIKIDEALFNDCKFSLEQLMELAGLGCALSIAHCYPARTDYGKVLVICGPGNNGGDGLVCARHLKLLGYEPQVVYPKPGRIEHFGRLVAQLESSGVHVFTAADWEQKQTKLVRDSQLLVDALFGFGFRAPVRPTFHSTMTLLKSTSVPIVSIDVPSGWHVDQGNVEHEFTPQTLISLTAPKLCSKFFNGNHYLSGRFVPTSIATAFNLDVSVYQNSDLFVKIH